MTAEIEPYVPRQPATVVARPDIDSWIAVVGDVAKLASHISDTAFVPDALRGNAAAVAAAILSGREAGVGPMASLQNINVIKGKPGQSALLMRQLALSAGHHIRYVETTDTRCVVEGRRRDEGTWGKVVFTADQARRARIDLGGYPEDKLVARATARLCRRMFADAIGGTPYTVEELEDGVDTDIIDATPAPAAVDPPKRTAQRRTTPKTRPAAADPIPPPPADPIATAEDLPPLPGEPGFAEAWRGSVARVDDDEPVVVHAEDRPITDPQMRKLQTVFTKHDVRARGDRLLIATQLAGREFDSAKDLTTGEASVVIDTLERVAIVAGEQFGDLLARLIEATGGAPADVDPDTGEVLDQPALSEEPE
jgi:hypothetical protein